MLTEEERRKFADYLRQDAIANTLIADHLDKIGHVELAKRMRLLADSQRLVASQLLSWEKQTVS